MTTRPKYMMEPLVKAETMAGNTIVYSCTSTDNMKDEQRLNGLDECFEVLEMAVFHDKPKAATLARIAAIALEWLEEERGIGD